LKEVSADDLRWAKEPWSRYQSCSAYSIRPQELAHAGELLGLGTHEELLRGFSLIAGESQEPPWVVSLPATLVAALRAVGPDETESLAARWGLVDEVGGVQPVESLIRFLAEVVGFLENNSDPIVLYITTGSA
jgi:hypothetical protein